MDPNQNNPAPPPSDPNQQQQQMPPQQPQGMPGGQMPYGPNPAYQPKQTNTMAIVALIVTFFVPVAGLVLGIIALNQIKQTHEDGKVLAIAAIVINAIQALFFIVFLTLFVIFADEISEFEENFPDVETVESVEATTPSSNDSSSNPSSDLCEGINFAESGEASEEC